MLDGRKVRVEFGSAEAHMRSKPWLMREKNKANEPRQQNNTESSSAPAAATEESAPPPPSSESYEPYPKRQRGDADFRERRPKKPVSHERVKPGQALYAAQRQKPSVQEFKGNKTVFE
jgi:hypothetical protein